MKKTIFVITVAMLLILASCGNTTEVTTTTKATTITESTNPLITDEQYTGETQTYTTTYATDSNGETVTDKSTTTEKTTTKKKNESTTKDSYDSDLQISYKSLNKMEAQLMKYTSLSKLIDLGNIKNNNSVLNSFKEENLPMIFNDKRFYIPELPDGCTFTSAYLSSYGYYLVNFKNGKKNQYIKIYTITDYQSFDTGKFTLKFESKKNVSIYQNGSKQLCWFQDNTYLCIYSGSSRDFINNLYMRVCYVNAK